MITIPINVADEMEAAFIMLLLEEMRKAILKHPMFPKDVVHQAAILCEESGEVIRAANQILEAEVTGVDEIKKEILHTAGVCCRMFKALPHIEILYFRKETTS